MKTSIKATVIALMCLVFSASVKAAPASGQVLGDAWQMHSGLFFPTTPKGSGMLWLSDRPVDCPTDLFKGQRTIHLGAIQAKLGKVHLSDLDQHEFLIHQYYAGQNETIHLNAVGSIYIDDVNANEITGRMVVSEEDPKGSSVTGQFWAKICN